MKLGGRFNSKMDMKLWFNFLIYLYGRNATMEDVIFNERERSEVWWA